MDDAAPHPRPPGPPARARAASSSPAHPGAVPAPGHDRRRRRPGQPPRGAPGARQADGVGDGRHAGGAGLVDRAPSPTTTAGRCARRHPGVATCSPTAEAAMRARLDDVLFHVDEPDAVPALAALRSGSTNALDPNDGSSAGWPGRARATTSWLRRLWPFLARHRRKVFTAFGVSLGTTLITVAIPLIERAGRRQRDRRAEPRALWPLLVLLVGLGAVNFVLSYIRRFVGGRVALDVQHDLRTAIFERVQRLDFARHDQLPTGQLVSRANSDLALVQALLSFLPLADRQRRAARAVARRDARALAAADADRARDRARRCCSCRCGCARVMFPAQWDAQQRAGEVAGVVDEAVSGVRVVKGFGQEDRELAGLADAAEGLYRSRVRDGAAAGAVPAGARRRSPPSARSACSPSAAGWPSRARSARHLPRLLHLPRAARRAGAHVRRHGRGRPAGARRRRADLRAARLQPTRHRAARRARPARRPRRGHASRTSASATCARSRCCADFSLHVAPGETVALVGASGLGQVDREPAPPPLLRRAGRRDPHRRRRRARRHPRLAAPRGRRRVRGRVPVLRHRAREHRLRAPDATDDEVERAARVAGAHELHRRAARRLRHRGRRARAHPVRRPAPAHRLARAMLTDPRVLVLDDATSSVDARDRGADPRHAARGHGRPHDDAHRPPALDAAPRRPHRARGRRPGRRERHPRGAAARRRRAYRALLQGPGDDLEDDEAGRHPTVDADLRRCDRRRRHRVALGPQRARPRRCARSSHRRARQWRAAASGGSGARRAAAAVGSRWRPRRSCSPRSTRSPPADDDPDVDVAAEAAASEDFRLRAFLRPYRRPLLSASCSSWSTRC